MVYQFIPLSYFTILKVRMVKSQYLIVSYLEIGSL